MHRSSQPRSSSSLPSSPSSCRREGSRLRRARPTRSRSRPPSPWLVPSASPQGSGDLNPGSLIPFHHAPRHPDRISDQSKLSISNIGTGAEQPRQHHFLTLQALIARYQSLPTSDTKWRSGSVRLVLIALYQCLPASRHEVETGFIRLVLIAIHQFMPVLRHEVETGMQLGLLVEGAQQPLQIGLLPAAWGADRPLVEVDHPHLALPCRAAGCDC